MDERTLKALEYEKILEMLARRCSFSLSKEMALSIVPKTSPGFVRGMLAETTEGREFLSYAGEPVLGAVSDVRDRAVRAKLGSPLLAPDLLAVLDTLRAGSSFKRMIVKAEGDYPILKGMAQAVEDLTDLQRQIGRCIGDDGEILDGASETLASIRQRIRTTSGRIRDKMESIIRSPETTKYLQDALITIRNGRFVVPVKQEYKSAFPGIVHDQSSSGATLFIEPMAVVEMNNLLIELESQEKEEIDRILAELSRRVGAESDAIRLNVETLARLDLIFAKARLSREMDATEPILNDHGVVDIVNGRHPLLKGTVVPVSPRVGLEYTTLVITGPNTGGKTVSLKVVGLFALMTQSGLHIPADRGSRMAVFDSVFADIGDEQSIEQSLSTFSSHMSQIVRIVNSAGCRSLVLVDELGAGTDPAEGSALAMAILTYLNSVGARTIATTHYSQLKVFAYETEGFENASMEFDLETLRPTYRLVIGLPGSSNALAIAERLGLPPAIVHRARQSMGKDDYHVEELIRGIQEKNRLLDESLRRAREHEVEAERARLAYEKMMSQIRSEKDSIVRKAREDALQAVNKARRESEETLKALRQLLAQSRAASLTKDVVADLTREVRNEIDHLSAEVNLEEPVGDDGGPEPEYLDSEIVAGSTVYIPRYSQTGTVLEAKESSASVVVQVGAMRLAINREDVRPVRQHPTASSGPASSRESGLTASGEGQANDGALARQAAEQITTEVDLRGMTVDEALDELDRYLDRAALAGLPSVRIIHGKGTGALRQAVQSMLRRHHGISSFRLGDQSEGGLGVTVASLRQ